MPLARNSSFTVTAVRDRTLLVGLTALLASTIGWPVATADAAVLWRGNTHSDVGGAIVSVQGVAPNDEAVAIPIGPSGQDGVKIEPEFDVSKFVVKLERNYGTTVGNSLRRVLLSSLEGFALTSIRLDGVNHEFTPVVEFPAPADTQHRVELWDGNDMIWSDDAVPNGVGVVKADELPEFYEFEDPSTTDYLPRFEIRFGDPANVEVLGGGPIVLNGRVVISRSIGDPLAPTPADSIRNIELTGADLPEIRLLDEAIEAIPVPAGVVGGAAWLLGAVLAATGSVAALRRSRPA
jgi:hypothetical protein